VTGSVAAPPLPAWARWAVAGLVCVGWSTAVWTAGHVTTDPVLRMAALFVHLASLVAGFGAVLVLDWWGLQWLLGRRAFPEVASLSRGTHQLVWIGLAGLVLSGVLLSPELGTPLTQLKLVLVLLVALNGVQAHALQRRLESLRELPRRTLLRCVLTAGVSQGGWWGCVLIGFVNSRG
jgi:hypothetical protein